MDIVLSSVVLLMMYLNACLIRVCGRKAVDTERGWANWRSHALVAAGRVGPPRDASRDQAVLVNVVVVRAVQAPVCFCNVLVDLSEQDHTEQARVQEHVAVFC